MEPFGAIFILFGLSLQYATSAFCALSIATTVIHTRQEIKNTLTSNGAPFWDYATNATGIKLRFFVGLSLFLGLGALLTSLAVWFTFFRSVFALSALMGARVFDALLSHIGASIFYKRPNPGFSSSFLYLFEVFCVWAFWKELTGYGVEFNWVAFWIGGSPFAVFWLYCVGRNLAKRYTKV